MGNSGKTEEVYVHISFGRVRHAESFPAHESHWVVFFKYHVISTVTQFEGICFTFLTATDHAVTAKA